MKRNTLIDVFRFVGAFLVVCIHIRFPKEFSDHFLMPVTRMAVPFFFMVSGYFLADINIDKMKQRLDKQIKHVFWLFAGAAAFYFCAEVIAAAIRNPGEVMDVVSRLWDWNRWYRFIAVNDTWTLFGPLSQHLWYLIALVYSMAAIRLALEHYPLKKLFWAIPVIGACIVPLTLIKWGVHREWPAPLVRNFFTWGIPCVLAGAWMKCNTPRLQKLPRGLAAVLPIIFVLSSMAERYAFNRWTPIKSMNIYFNSLLLAASVIVLSLHFPGAGGRGPFARWGARYSLMIYIIQYFIIWLIEHAAAWLGIEHAPWYRWTAPVLVFAASLVFSMVWEWGKDQMKNRGAHAPEPKI